jgi:hypothetical protein
VANKRRQRKGMGGRGNRVWLVESIFLDVHEHKLNWCYVSEILGGRTRPASAKLPKKFKHLI